MMWVSGSTSSSTMDLSSSTSAPLICTSICLPSCLDMSRMMRGNRLNTVPMGCIRVCMMPSCSSEVTWLMFCRMAARPGMSRPCPVRARSSWFLLSTSSPAWFISSVSRSTRTRRVSGPVSVPRCLPRRRLPDSRFLDLFRRADLGFGWAGFGHRHGSRRRCSSGPGGLDLLADRLHVQHGDLSFRELQGHGGQVGLEHGPEEDGDGEVLLQAAFEVGDRAQVDVRVEHLPHAHGVVQERQRRQSLVLDVPVQEGGGVEEVSFHGRAPT